MIALRHRPPAGHTVLTPDALENLAHSAELTISLPVGAGWATTRVGGQRFAAWVAAPEGGVS